MDDLQLIHPEKKILISVSGGVDSIALADVMAGLGIRFELLHFNHGTRALENAQEENLVRELAKKWEVIVHVIPFQISLNDNNFENTARVKRQEIYQEFIQKEYWIYTAHHIDDSFEWSLMQSFKQSSTKSTLGIPVFNRGMVRPFMAVTKKQILRYARAKKLSWLEDTSNQNDKFERNFLRLHLTKTIFRRYPQVLKHYVSRSNQLALLQNIHRQSENEEIRVSKEVSGGTLIIAKNFRRHKEFIKECIYELSSKERGKIDQEIEKMLKAQEEILKNPALFPFKGPMNISGGVSLFLIRNQLLITSSKQLDFYKLFDQKLKDHIQNLTQIPFGFVNFYPKLAISFRKKLQKSSKFIHPLLPLTCSWLKEQNISYGFSPLLSRSDRQMLTNDAVILDSSLLGL